MPQSKQHFSIATNTTWSKGRAGGRYKTISVGSIKVQGVDNFRGCWGSILRS